MDLEQNDLADLKRAKQLLESPGFLAKIISVFGTPIERGFAMLPDKWNVKIANMTQSALGKAVDAAFFTIKDSPGRVASNALHRVAVGVTGGVGGFLGLTSLAIELPLSTAIMFRSIADVARSQGEIMDQIESKMACLEVFAMGGTSKDDDAAESGYFAVRAALAGSVSRTAEHIAEKGLTREGAPVLAGRNIMGAGTDGIESRTLIIDVIGSSCYI